MIPEELQSIHARIEKAEYELVMASDELRKILEASPEPKPRHEELNLDVFAAWEKTEFCLRRLHDMHE